MNRTDRLLAIVLALQGGGARRAEDLAATFETSVRTIYRDMQALSETGVPVVATPGVGYALMAGYFLPPLTFTADEATALLLGGDVVGQYFDAGYRAVAETATRKITAVLPEKLRHAVHERSDRLRFVVPEVPSPAVDATLRTLRRAVLEGIGVRFHYHGWRNTRDGSPPTPREADPHALVLVSGVWFLVAHDHLRGAVRHFRLDRIEALSLSGRTFTPPPRQDWRGDDEPRPVMVRALFTPAVARRVRELPSYFAVAYDEGEDGLLVTLRARTEVDVLSWLLGWGSAVRVLEPPSVRALLAGEAAAILAQYYEPPATS